ncbi:MAG: glycosyltransferase family 4 protein [Gammaproteobacteria bacterium]
MKEMDALIRRGVEVHFFSNVFKDDSEFDGIKCFGRIPGIRGKLIAAVTLIKYPCFFIPRLLRNWREAVRIAIIESAVMARVQKYQIDIIHTHFLWPQGECCELASRSNKVPLVATLRGAELRDEPDLGYGSMRDPWFRKNFESSKKTIAYFTAPNSGLRRALIREHGVEPDRVCLLPNGVERIDLPLPLRTVSTHLKMVVVGNFVKVKNHGWLLETLSALSASGWELDIYGNGPEQFALEAIVLKNNLWNVRICGVQPKLRLMEIIRDADVLVHPSTMEGMPNVVLESMAMGTPVVVSNIDAHRDIVTDGYNGYFFDLNSPSSLRALVRSFIQQPSRLSRLSPNCLATAKDYALDVKIDGYLKLYDNLTRSAYQAVNRGWSRDSLFQRSSTDTPRTRRQ